MGSDGCEILPTKGFKMKGRLWWRHAAAGGGDGMGRRGWLVEGKERVVKEEWQENGETARCKAM